jgi:hypothetical protein
MLLYPTIKPMMVFLIFLKLKMAVGGGVKSQILPNFPQIGQKTAFQLRQHFTNHQICTNFAMDMYLDLATKPMMCF